MWWLARWQECSAAGRRLSPETPYYDMISQVNSPHLKSLYSTQGALPGPGA